MAKFPNWPDLSFAEKGNMEELARKELAARKAGYRGVSAKQPDRQLDEYLRTLETINLNAPVGCFKEFDSVILRMQHRRRLKGQWISVNCDSVISCRFGFHAMIKQAVLAARDAAGRDQPRRDLIAIRSKISAMRSHMLLFLEHVDADISHLFEREGEPSVFKSLSAAQRRLDNARRTVAAAERALADLISCHAINLDPSHDGRSDWLMIWYLRACAYAWEGITGKTPGKTAHGFFKQACVGAWTMLGWPIPKGTDLNAIFEARIARGVL